MVTFMAQMDSKLALMTFTASSRVARLFATNQNCFSFRLAEVSVCTVYLVIFKHVFIIRLHRMREMQTIVTDVSGVVRQSVCHMAQLVGRAESVTENRNRYRDILKNRNRHRRRY